MSRSARIALLCLLACVPEKDGASDSTDGTGGTDTAVSSTAEPTTSGGDELCSDHAQTDTCCCFRDDMGTTSVCGGSQLCPLLMLGCKESPAYICAAADLAIADEAAVDCLLLALANGEAGKLAWFIDDLEGGGTYEDVRLDLVGDGTLFRQGGYLEDNCVEVYAVDRVPLPAGDYFMGCLEAADWRDRFECLRNGLETAPSETCIAGYSHDTPTTVRSRPGAARPLAGGRYVGSC